MRVGKETYEINIGREDLQTGIEINIETVVREFGPGHITESRVSAIKPLSEEVYRPRMAVRV